jgi:hypothetical protein
MELNGLMNMKLTDWSPEIQFYLYCAAQPLKHYVLDPNRYAYYPIRDKIVWGGGGGVLGYIPRKGRKMGVAGYWGRSPLW